MIFYNVGGWRPSNRWARFSVPVVFCRPIVVFRGHVNDSLKSKMPQKGHKNPNWRQHRTNTGLNTFSDFIYRFWTFIDRKSRQTFRRVIGKLPSCWYRCGDRLFYILWGSVRNPDERGAPYHLSDVFKRVRILDVDNPQSKIYATECVSRWRNLLIPFLVFEWGFLRSL